MGRMRDFKKLAESAGAALTDSENRAAVAKAAGDAVVGTASAMAAAESVGQRAGLAKRNGGISKFKVAKSLLSPVDTGKTILAATAAEISERRAAPESATTSEQRDIPNA